MKRMLGLVALGLITCLVLGSAVAQKAPAKEEKAPAAAQKAPVKEPVAPSAKPVAPAPKPAVPAAMVTPATGLTVTRLLTCTGVENKEPVGVAETFPATTEKVFCFLEAGNIDEDSIVTFAWYLGDKEMAKVDLTLKKSSRWRTFSSKNIAGRKGDWKVDLLDSKGTVLKSASFKIE